MKTVLIIDDNEDYRETVRCILEQNGLEVYETDCPDTAFDLLGKIDAPDLIVCDLHMPFTTKENAHEFKHSFEVGVKTVHELAWVYPDTPVVAVTSLEDIDIPRVRRYLSPIPMYQKPDSVTDMIEILRCYLVSKEWGGMQ
jgi:CheY-like chemotaxis protein